MTHTTALSKPDLNYCDPDDQVYRRRIFKVESTLDQLFKLDQFYSAHLILSKIESYAKRMSSTPTAGSNGPRSHSADPMTTTEKDYEIIPRLLKQIDVLSLENCKMCSVVHSEKVKLQKQQLHLEAIEKRLQELERKCTTLEKAALSQQSTNLRELNLNLRQGRSIPFFPSFSSTANTILQNISKNK